MLTSPSASPSASGSGSPFLSGSRSVAVRVAVRVAVPGPGYQVRGRWDLGDAVGAPIADAVTDLVDRPHPDRLGDADVAPVRDVLVDADHVALATSSLTASSSPTSTATSSP